MDVASFWPIVKRDAEYLREQFEIYSADLVICCGSIVAAAFYEYIIKPSNLETWKTTTRGVSYLEYAPGKFVISYSHPEARVAENLLYYGLVDAVQEIQQLKRS